MLIKTKFQIPDFGNRLVKRKRLTDKLDQNENCKVIIVKAPAGFGKTALISSWSAYSIKKQKVTWLMLEDEDNDEELFWSYFLVSFYGNIWVPEDMKQRAETMLSNAISFNRMHLTYLINDMIELGIQITMVLDDFGVIRDKKIINDLEFLMRHLPSNAHLILSGREFLNTGLAKYKASGETLVLTGEELSFTQEETISLFRNTAQIHLSREEYGKISHAFEGWAAGMQLMALTLNKAEKLTVPRVSGNRLIYIYLMEEVIGVLDDNIKNFLIKTLALEQFVTIG